MNFTRCFKNRCSEYKSKILNRKMIMYHIKVKETVTQVAVMYLIGETGGW